MTRTNSSGVLLIYVAFALRHESKSQLSPVCPLSVCMYTHPKNKQTSKTKQSGYCQNEVRTTTSLSPALGVWPSVSKYT